MKEILVQKQEQISLPIWLLGPSDLENLPPSFPGMYSQWINAVNFQAALCETSIISDPEGNISAVLFGLGANHSPTDDGADARRIMSVGKLARSLPSGCYHFENSDEGNEDLTALAWLLGGYQFDRYLSGERQEKPKLAVNADKANILSVAESVCLTRDLVNTPTNDLGPAHLEQAFRSLGDKYQAEISVIKGDDLLNQNFPMIHAVGRASVDAPRLLDLAWGDPGNTKVTLVGKGVCFDTGGLNIKPGSSMAAMKKDMGGAANVMGLAQMIMDAKLPVRLRVLIPAVENSISGNAFRPGDILPSRKGISVEIGNTDAEGRLVLGDALALADEQSPEILIDMATLTGAARVALGPDLPPFYTADAVFANEVADAGLRLNDPVWRMPLWAPYSQMLSSKIADVNHISTGGFAGSITAALFLEKFVEKAATWAHFDIYASTATDKPWARAGGEAQAIRSLFDVLSKRFSA